MNVFYKSVSALLVTIAAATALRAAPPTTTTARSERQRACRAPRRDHEDNKHALAVLSKDANASNCVSKAYGRAVFDTTKGGFIVTGGWASADEEPGGRSGVHAHGRGRRRVRRGPQEVRARDPVREQGDLRQVRRGRVERGGFGARGGTARDRSPSSTMAWRSTT